MSEHVLDGLMSPKQRKVLVETVRTSKSKTASRQSYCSYRNALASDSIALIETEKTLQNER